jgi:Domain of unknown function (DUF4124)
MRSIALLAALLLPLAATAEVYSWKDANGKIHYSDHPPADKGQATRTLAPEPITTDDTEKARTSAAERRLETNKSAKEAKEKSEKAEKQRADDAQRQQDCERARLAVQGLESGQIRFRMGANGEREALEDNARDAELANARRAAEVSCSPRPVGDGTAPAAPKKPPGY